MSVPLPPALEAALRPPLYGTADGAATARQTLEAARDDGTLGRLQEELDRPEHVPDLTRARARAVIADFVGDAVQAAGLWAEVCRLRGSDDADRRALAAAQARAASHP